MTSAGTRPAEDRSDVRKLQHFRELLPAGHAARRAADRHCTSANDIVRQSLARQQHDLGSDHVSRQTDIGPPA
jgi:hypothetical protein